MTATAQRQAETFDAGSTQQQRALRMLFEAHQEQDILLKPFLVDAAMKHLEFLVALERLATFEEPRQ